MLFEGELKKQVVREDGSCLFSVDTEHSAWDCFISTLMYSQRRHVLRGGVVNVTAVNLEALLHAGSSQILIQSKWLSVK